MEATTTEGGEQTQRQHHPDRKVILGELPNDFLRLVEWRPANQGPPSYGPSSSSSSYQHQQHQPADANLRQGFLNITLVKAKLAKNYGMMTMDPYVVFTVGPYRRRSRVAAKGGIEPRWNEVLRLPVLAGFTTLRIDVYDFRSITGDKHIGWGEIDVYSIDETRPEEKLYHLSGKQGEDKEGVVSLHIRYEPTLGPPVVRPPRVVTTTYGADPMMGHYAPQPPLPHVNHAPVVPAYDVRSPQAMGPPPQQPYGHHPPPPPPPQYQQQQQQQPPPGALNATMVQELQAMFPQLGQDVIEDVLRSNGGDMDAALTQLLAMNQ